MVKRARTTIPILVLMAIASGHADAQVQSNCLASKNKCVAKKARALLKCEQKAETPGKPADPNADGCVDKAKEKFDGGVEPDKGCFEKLENKAGNDCITFDDTASLESLVDQCVADLIAAVDPAPIDQTKCGVGKKKCVAKKLAGLLKCHAKAETPGKPTDPNTGGCVDKARAKFDGGAEPEKGCVVKLENKPENDCLPPLGNQAGLEAIVDGCVDAIVSALETPTPTTTTTTLATTTTTSTTTIAGSTTTTTTSPTTSTTTTTNPSSVTCSSSGLDVTVSINYPEPLLGGVSAILLALNYPPPLAIPGSGNVLSVRQRVTNLIGPGSQVSPNDRDTNANGVDDRLDVQARASTTGSINPGPVFRVRYDCPSGTPISASSLSCSHSQATALDGQPFPPELNALITCSFTLSPA